MAVHLTRIYTRTGDDGTTGLSDFSRVSKNDARLEAYADCDETNAALGVAVALGQPDEQILQGAAPDPERPVRRGRRPVHAGGREPEYPPLRITQDYIDRLEAWCDEFNEPLPALNSFILPGGTPLSALLHVARTVARRAERSAWRAVDATRRFGQRAAREVPEPAVGPAVHPVAGGEPGRRRAVAARRMSACAKTRHVSAARSQLGRRRCGADAPAATDATPART